MLLPVRFSWMESAYPRKVKKSGSRIWWGINVPGRACLPGPIYFPTIGASVKQPCAGCSEEDFPNKSIGSGYA